MPKQLVCWPVIITLLLLAQGCTSLMGSVTGKLASDLSATILDSDDPETVAAAIPAYLMLIDSLLRQNPDDAGMLIAAAQLNGSFAGVFVDDPLRAGKLTDKALDYALRALCISEHNLCELRKLPFDEFQQTLAGTRIKTPDSLYVAGTAWTSWIQAHSSDWNAIAELARVRLIMERMLMIDESFDHGGPHLYMAGLDTLLPESMGGRPEQGRLHFEKAIEYNGGKFLMAKVIYAEQYARLVFDKELHDRLLKEVLEASPNVAGMTLTNTIAQRLAAELLAGSADYF